MSWASEYIKELQAGRPVEFRPTGGSMKPHIQSGQLVRVTPIVTEKDLKVGDIVLCNVNGNDYLHFIKAIDITKNGKTLHFQIGNAHGGINGWATKIFGRLTALFG